MSALETAKLGRTGLEVTRLGYGAMEIRDAPRGRPVTEEQVGTILNAVLDAGITFIDTSNDYGRSEEFIGRHISHRRSEFVLATKCGCVAGGGDHVWTRENLFRGLTESLQRLKTDYVDIMQLHGPPAGVAEEEGVVEALEEMRTQGKVRWIANSTRVPDLPTYLDPGAFDEFQIPYSALERTHEEWISKSAQAGIGTVIRGGVAQGEPGQGRGQSDKWDPFEAAKLDELLDDGETKTGFLLRYTLTHPDVHTTIVGTLREDHLQENLRAAARGPLSNDTYAEAKRRLDAVGVKPDPAT